MFRASLDYPLLSSGSRGRFAPPFALSASSLSHTLSRNGAGRTLPGSTEAGNARSVAVVSCREVFQKQHTDNSTLNVGKNSHYIFTLSLAYCQGRRVLVGA